MKFPIVRLVGRGKIKVIYADKKWAFEKGIEYKDVHPSFSAHLATLKDDKGVLLFEIEHKFETVKVTTEKTVEATNEDDALRIKMNKKSKRSRKDGHGILKRKPVKLNTE